MSDTTRQSITDQLKNAAKPDSEKSFTEHMGDKIRGKTDRVQAAVEPESEKSYTQKAADTVRGGLNNLSEKAKEAFSSNNDDRA